VSSIPRVRVCVRAPQKGCFYTDYCARPFRAASFIRRDFGGGGGGSRDRLSIPITFYTTTVRDSASNNHNTIYSYITVCIAGAFKPLYCTCLFININIYILTRTLIGLRVPIVYCCYDKMLPRHRRHRIYFFFRRLALPLIKRACFLFSWSINKIRTIV